MSTALERRLRIQRSRAVIRSWEHRQRHHAQGVWYRLRRLLADASAAYVISHEDASTLMAEGYSAEEAGLALEPKKTILVVPAERVARVASAREIPVRLGPDLLSADCLALTPFPR